MTAFNTFVAGEVLTAVKLNANTTADVQILVANGTWTKPLGVISTSRTTPAVVRAARRARLPRAVVAAVAVSGQCSTSPRHCSARLSR